MEPHPHDQHPLPPGGPRPRYPYPPPPMPPRRSGFGCSGCAIAGLVVALIGSLLLNMMLTVGNAAAGMSVDGAHQEILYDGDMLAESKIMLLSIEGAIMEGGWPPSDPVEDVRRQLKLVEQDTSIRGVMVRVDSPGGGITASDDIYNMLKQVKVPVYVSMGSMAASGGYYVAVAGSKIFAEHTTITGSIGVLIGSYNITELMEKHGVQDVTTASGSNKELLSMTKPVQPEHQVIIQGIVDQMYERFLDVIMAGRQGTGLTRDALRAVADGRILLAQDALDAKLIDQIAYLDEALDVMRQDLGLTSNVKVVSYKRIEPFGGLFGVAAPQRVEIGVDRRGLYEAVGPQALTLWKP